MKVADLQQYLNDLAKLLQAADGKKSAAELARISEHLQPFLDYELTAFGDFLVKAEEYARTGVVPPVGGKKTRDPKPTPDPKPPAGPKPNVSALREEVKRFYETVSSPTVTIESIDEFRPRLEPLSKADLVTVAEAIGIVGSKSKSKPEVLNAIVNRIKSVKQSSIRTSIIDRPGTTY